MKRDITAEYIWIDGRKPTKLLRSKTMILPKPVTNELKLLPMWSFDGSSTEQAEGHFSDCFLKPVCSVPDPVRQGNNLLVMCEVLKPDGSPHPSNTRAVLAGAVARFARHDPWFGVEQEYTLYKRPEDWPVGWPEGRGFPSPQGRYYCGVGADEVHGRPLVEKHLLACMDAGLKISGINAEVMPAQWEFQIGPASPLATADQLWLARWLLYRLGEEFNFYAKLDPKPMDGDWNGAGGHTNFSTKSMRASRGMNVIQLACDKLGKFHNQHMLVYGADNNQRLTGKHETCSVNDFRWGIGDRGASVRIPTRVANNGKGYLEDRRPAANLDPYQVFTAILDTVCGRGFNPTKYDWV